MSTLLRQVNKVLIAQEDIAIGEEPVVQIRQGESTPLSKVRLLGITNNQGELEALDPTKYPKALLIDKDEYRLLQFSGQEYSDLVSPIRYAEVEVTNPVVDVTNLQTLFLSAQQQMTVSQFEGGKIGQELTIIARTGFLSIMHNFNIVLKDSTDRVLTLYSSLKLVFDGQVWVEI